MRRIIYVYTLLLLPWISFSQEDFSIDLIPDSLLSHANTIIRLHEETIDATKKGETKKRIRKVFTLTNEDGEGEIYIGYDEYFEKIKKLKVVILDAFGREVTKFKEKDFLNRSAFAGSSVAQDYRYYYLNTDRTDFPYTVDLSYEVHNKRGEFNYQDIELNHFGRSIQHLQVNYHVTDDTDINYYLVNTNEEPHKSMDEKGIITYSWAVSNIKALESEKWMPASTNLLSRVAVNPKFFKLEDYEGTNESWSNFGKFIYELNKSREVVTSDMKMVANELTIHCKNDKEKINAIYDYLKEKMRYVSIQLGIGGWQSLSSDYVHENSFGDCKALSLYTKAMLEEVGVEAKCALINRGGDRAKQRTQENIVDPRFNHVIVYLPTEDMWLECTSNSYPAGYIGIDNEDRFALIWDETGGKEMKTPDPKSEINFEDLKAQIELKVDGSAKLKIDHLYSGGFHQKLRRYLARKSDDDVGKLLQELLSPTPVTIENIRAEYDKNTPIATVTGNYETFKYGSANGDRLFVPINAIDQVGRNVMKDKNRIWDIYQKWDYRKLLTLEFEIPTGYKIESLPFQNKEYDTVFGYYSIKIESKDNKVFVTREFVEKSGTFPKEEFKEFRSFYRKILKSENAKMVLIRE